MSQSGSVLLMLLVLVALLGLMGGIAGSSWKTIVQRSKEADLLFKGAQIRSAIERYYHFNMQENELQAGPNTYPHQLEDLLDDPRSLQTQRYLRRLYLDPMTGKEWELIKAPDGVGIIGVHSGSTGKPFKQSGFSGENRTFDGKQSYQDWQFVYQFEKPGEKKQENPATTATNN